MSEEQQQAKLYMFSHYPEDNEAIDAFANAKCRGNRSEAVRRMIGFALTFMAKPTGVTTEHYVATHPDAEVRS